jgi:hypothetical protein
MKERKQRDQPKKFVPFATLDEFGEQEEQANQLLQQQQ